MLAVGRDGAAVDGADGDFGLGLKPCALGSRGRTPGIAVGGRGAGIGLSAVEDDVLLEAWCTVDATAGWDDIAVRPSDDAGRNEDPVPGRNDLDGLLLLALLSPVLRLPAEAE